MTDFLPFASLVLLWVFLISLPHHPVFAPFFRRRIVYASPPQTPSNPKVCTRVLLEMNVERMWNECGWMRICGWMELSNSFLFFCFSFWLSLTCLVSPGCTLIQTDDGRSKGGHSKPTPQCIVVMPTPNHSILHGSIGAGGQPPAYLFPPCRRASS